MQDIDLRRATSGWLRPPHRRSSRRPPQRPRPRRCRSEPPASSPGRWSTTARGSAGSAEVTQLVGAVNKGGKAIGGIIAIIVLASVVVPIAGRDHRLRRARATRSPTSATSGRPTTRRTSPARRRARTASTCTPSRGTTRWSTRCATRPARRTSSTRCSTRATPCSTSRPASTSATRTSTGTARRWRQNTSRGTSSDGQIDLAVVDPELIISTARHRARPARQPGQLVRQHLRQRRVRRADQRLARATSFGESATLIMGLDGTVIYDSEASP